MTRIRKLLVANRGEIVVRIADTARAMGVATVAVYSEPDVDSPHVAACDEAVALGGATPGESYLRGDAIVEAALRVGADAVHPGFGFLAENAGFARAVQEAGLIWVGPHPDAIASMGDKLRAKAIMTEAGVPTLGSVEVTPDTDLDAAWQEVGGPVLVKAAAGGGGKGMRICRDRGELEDAVAAAMREAAGAFGDERVFIERYVTRPRHVEVQVLGDQHGNILHLFERECSVQRRYQKVVEESPSTALTPQLRTAMGDAAVAAARAIGYDNAGTVEFVLGEADEQGQAQFHFLEMNTRLQVEHPVTEMVVHRTDLDEEPIDLVALQLRVAEGERLPFTQDDLVQSGHAIEVRLYAEDPSNDYLPATGTLHTFRPASLPGVRWDAGVVSGSVVSTHYDPMLAKVIARGRTRDEAAAVLARALETTQLHGVVTNRDLLVAILRDEAFLAGDTTTAYLDERFPTEEDRTFPPADAAVRFGAIAAALHGQAARSAERRVHDTIPSGWRNNRGYDQRVRFEAAGATVEVHYRRQRDGSWAVAVDGEETEVRLHRQEAPDRLDLEVAGHRTTAHVTHVRDAVTGQQEWHVVTALGYVTLSQIPRFPRVGLEEVAGATLSPMPGAVVSVAVEEGQAVSEGDLLVVVEAMKMEHRITAPHDGTVTEVRVQDGQQVESGEVLVVVEQDPTATEDQA